MPMTYLKSAPGQPPETAADVADTVQVMLARLRSGGAQVALEYARSLDGWQGEITVTRNQITAASARVPQALKDDIDWAHDNISRFAEAQRATAQDMQIELRPGLIAGQRQIPLGAAGCYVPGGRYSHIASALMSIATARVAGVADITACSPPCAGKGIPDAMLYAMDIAGATRILTIGGVQGIAALAFGLFGAPPADILVGPGNAYVAEAKRQLFGPIGIDMFAGPTDSLILADATADAGTVAADLVGQAEHGANSPVWLATTDSALARAVLDRIPALIAVLPEPNRTAAATAWADLGEVALCDSPEDMARFADAPGEGVGDGARLLENLFQHEMLVAPLFRHLQGPGDGLRRFFDGISVERREVHPGRRKNRHFTILENDHVLGVAENGRVVRGDEI
nr:histidinol dehydrogenase [Roseovarius sp.]